MVYLTSVTETYHIDTEKEVEDLIAAAKNDATFKLAKYTRQEKEIKVKGEGTVGEWYKVTLTKDFDDIKEPCVVVVPNYEVQG